MVAHAGVGRTAITLRSGIQEIYPDTTVSRFDVVPLGTAAGRGLHVLKNDGTEADTIPVDSIMEMNYGPLTDYESFAGDWYLVASPLGEPNEVGLMVSTVVSMPYHAVLPAPGSADYGRYIYCHIDSVAHRKGLKYAADFKLRYDYDAASGQGTIALVLDDRRPVSPQQYGGDAGSYAYFDAAHTYYLGVHPQHEGGDTGMRYMYFVGQNIERQSLEGMELQATWTHDEHCDPAHEYQMPQNQQIYWIVALDVPYSFAEHDEIGYIDMFSSVRLMRREWTKSLQEE